MRSSSILALIALASGCKAVDADPVLYQFSDCDELDTYMQRMSIEEERYNWSWSFGVATEYTMSTQSAAGGDESAAMDDSASASSYSSTNVAEQGVDEDDLVKTDGTYFYSLSGKNLEISQTFPTESAALLSTVEIDGTPSGLYLVDDVVVVVSQIWDWDTGSIHPRSGASWDRMDYVYTLVTVVDVSDRKAPTVARETYTTGEFKESRRIGDQLYVVTYQDVDVASDAEDLASAKRDIKDAKTADWLPGRMDNLLAGTTWSVTKGEACDCTDVWASDAESGTYLTNVLSLDLSDPLAEFKGESVSGRADTVYASVNAIYVGWSEWSSGAFPTTDQRIDTILHKFDISGADPRPGYRGSTKVSGSLIDQFAVSEYDDVLRVATTELDEEAGSVSSVYTLEENNAQFTELDKLEGLAPGESIFAARFVGDLGYVVTYEQQMGDPLFTIDLSDPSDIRLAGALEISGWSNYLHPMDAGHLLAIGFEQNDDWSGQLAISLFDVSDLDNPTLADRLILDAWDSEANSEHHAFNYFADKEVLAVPSWTSESESVLEVIHATTDGLSSIGRVHQTALTDAAGDDAWCGSVRRSVIMDDTVWAVSALGLVAADISDPETNTAVVAFDSSGACDSDYYY